jgi:thymidylate synthase (FAD)
MKIDILDNGYVEFREAWGRGKDKRHRPETERRVSVTELVSERVTKSDYEIGIIEAARQSTQGSFRGWEEDAKLLAFLYTNQHNTPFEFAGFTIEIMAPISVFREWHRHRTQSYNEMSARYAPLPDLCYVPTLERIEQVNQAGRNKQAAGVAELLPHNVAYAREIIFRSCQRARQDYEELLSLGVAKELARGVLPVFQYSKQRATANLRNWLAFLTLRCDPRAQWEIRQFADAVGKIIEETFPQTYNLWFEEFHSV